MINHHTIALQEYIFFSPENVRQKFYNGHEWEDNNWHTHTGDSYFAGLLFRNNRVFAINIYIFQRQKDFTPHYLEITDVFNEILKDLNIYHTCLLFQKVLKKYYRESTLVEKNEIRLKYDRKYHLPKFRHHITKHHNRERKFCENYSGEHRGIWHQILYQSITQSSDFSTFKQQRNERPTSLFIIHSCQTKLPIRKTNLQHTKCVSGNKPRKPRRQFTAFNPEKRR